MNGRGLACALVATAFSTQAAAQSSPATPTPALAATASTVATPPPSPVVQQPHDTLPVTEPDIPRTTGAHEVKRWYGDQTLIADGAALAFLVATAATDRTVQEGFATATVGTYLLGGPMVHAAHDNWGRATASFFLRAGAPVVGAAVGAAMEECNSGDLCGLGGGLVGFSLGVVSAIVIDSAALARETVRDERRFVPAFEVNGKRTWVGVSGRF